MLNPFAGWKLFRTSNLFSHSWFVGVITLDESLCPLGCSVRGPVSVRSPLLVQCSTDHTQLHSLSWGWHIPALFSCVWSFSSIAVVMQEEVIIFPLFSSRVPGDSPCIAKGRLTEESDFNYLVHICKRWKFHKDFGDSKGASGNDTYISSDKKTG